jgi:sensor histidine kinase YesM
MDALTAPSPRRGLAERLGAGFRASPLSIFLVAALNTGIALALWIDDPRPFWHPFVTVQLYGFSIAYCVNVVSPWDRPRAFRRLLGAVAVGALIGVLLVIVAKGYDRAYVASHASIFVGNVVASMIIGLFVSLFFHVRIRDSLAEAALQRAEAGHHLLSRQAVEAQLKMMQAQIEPHFLFNTLASMQYLIETDPPSANVLLTHLIGYLRAALPQLRAASSTLGQEARLIEAYLNILKMRMGDRLAFVVDVPEALRGAAFPPNLVISLVENAVKHGLEPTVHGGSVEVTAAAEGDRLVVRVRDTGTGIATGESPSAGMGVGLSNIRERLAALYGERATFTMAAAPGGGTLATLSIPLAHD